MVVQHVHEAQEAPEFNGAASPLAAWRAVYNVSQADLARAAGVSQPTISNMERAATPQDNATLAPRLPTLVAVAAATESLRPGRGMTAAQLLGHVLETATAARARA